MFDNLHGGLSAGPATRHGYDKIDELPVTPTSAKWAVLFVVGTGSFMAALNTGVVNVALPTLRRTYDADVAGVEWVVTAYLLVISGTLLAFGWFGDTRGHRRIYVAGYAMFTASSVLCGVAPSLGTLIAFRGLEGLGVAMLAANETVILIRCFPTSQRGRAFGLQSTMTYLGLMAGPALGGWLSGSIGWRAVFLVNVPLGTLGLVLCLLWVPRDGLGERRREFDVVGALTLAACLAALLLALNRGRDWGWESPPILALVATAVISAIAFVMVECRSPHPMLDISLFRRRDFTGATLSSVLNNLCVAGILFLVPFALIQGRGFSPALVGLLLSIRSIVMVIVAPLGGLLSDRVGTRPLRLVGLVVEAMGALLLAHTATDSSVNQFALALAVVGLGSGMFIAPNNSALMGAAPVPRRGVAGGVLALARNGGMALGTGLAGAVLSAAVPPGQAGGVAMVLAARPGLLLAAATALLGAACVTLWERQKDGLDLSKAHLSRAETGKS